MLRTLTVMSLLGILTAAAQVEAHRPGAMTDIPEFSVDALSFASGDSTVSRVDVYVQVPYDALQFVKAGGAFAGRYEVTVNLLSPDGALQSEKVWNEEVRVPSFEATISRNGASISQRSVTVPPGIYTVRTQVRDLESKKVSTVVRKIIAGNYNAAPLSVSDIMLVSRLTQAGDRRSITPNVSGNIAESGNRFLTFFEIYAAVPADSAEVHYIVTDNKGRQMVNWFQQVRLSGRKTPVIARFDSAQYATGAYMVSIEVLPKHAPADLRPVLKQRAFVVRTGNLPVSVTDLDLAIRQARYIARDNEYELFEKAGSDDEKRTLFDEFWKRRDPNPATQRNEVMEEYYGRVQYANEHFTHYIPGWRTDMGMVFIIFGAPNNVERHPFDIDSKPYEIWSYYEYSRNVVFVDETGFGDYRLLTPIWDLIQRLKY